MIDKCKTTYYKYSIELISTWYGLNINIEKIGVET